MNYVIKTAKTVEKAVSEALNELNINKDDAEIEILEEPSSGFFGIIGSKNAIVKVSKKFETKELLEEIFSDEFEKSQKNNEFENKASENAVSYEENLKNENSRLSEKSNDIEKIAEEFIDKIMKQMEIDYSLEISFKNKVLDINILGNEKQLGLVIGKRGTTIDSIQYILSLIINRHSNEYIKVNLDSSDYREKRKVALEELAIKIANKVIKTKRSIKLEPMNARERKIIHEALQNYEGVITHSEGKDPFRKIVIQKEIKY